jgi:hypothetical protein
MLKRTDFLLFNALPASLTALLLLPHRVNCLAATDAKNKIPDVASTVRRAAD